MILNYKELIVWQKSVILAVKTYEITENFPRTEIFGLTSQMRRSSVSIASNIAEGRCRSTRKDFMNFLKIAHGSSAELQTQIEIAKKLSFSEKLDYNIIESGIEEIILMLRSMISKLASKP